MYILRHPIDTLFILRVIHLTARPANYVCNLHHSVDKRGSKSVIGAKETTWR